MYILQPFGTFCVYWPSCDKQWST